ncbi:MAG: PRC-barrel domain-containing protein, partial [Corynebacterium casei]
MSKNVQDLLSATAYDNNGDKLGDVNEVFVDDDSGQPTFVDVNHGLFGMGNSLVPLRGHSIATAMRNHHDTKGDNTEL